MMKFAIASAVALFVAAPAFAGTFEGFRVEVNGGLDRVGGKVDGEKAHKNGFVYGAEAGWDYEGNGFVVGPYAGIDMSTAKFCDGYTFSGGSYRACIKARRNFEVGLRAGAVVSKEALVYVKVAYANGRISASEHYVNGSSSFDYHDAINRGGIRAGIGTEYAVGSHTYLKVEYRYTRYKALEDVRFNRNQIVGGIGYRF